MDAYKHVLSGDFCEYYDMLVGPDGFECLLTEPEDRNWYRDGRVVIDRLNDQHAELSRLRAEIERLREERRWIPVEERLPPLRGYYLIAWYNMRVTTAFWHGQEWDTLARDRITHWQPLPAPPVEE